MYRIRSYKNTLKPKKNVDIRVIRIFNTYGPRMLLMTEEVTMTELAELIIQMTGSKSKIVYLPLPQDDPVRRKPLIDLAEKELRKECIL